MQERIYSARPINTYTGVGAVVGAAYVAHLLRQYPNAEIVDPGNAKGEVSLRAKELFEAAFIDPATGLPSEEYYNKHGAKTVMAYFTEHVVPACTLGVGLLLPMRRDGQILYAVGAGVAAELVKMHELKRPIYVVECMHNSGMLDFAMHRVNDLTEDTARGADPLTKRPLMIFHADSTSFTMLTVDETRARMYTPKPDGGWDRDNLQPYFLD